MRSIVLKDFSFVAVIGEGDALTELSSWGYYKIKEFFDSFLVEMGYNNFSVKDISGSSQCYVFLVNNERIFKVGPKKEAEAEQATYRKFWNRLSNYENIFPNIHILKQKDGVVVWGSEMVGDVDLEQKIFDVLDDPVSYSDIVDINGSVLEKIEKVFEGSYFTDKNSIEEQNQLFFDEMVSALEKNLVLGGFTEEEINKCVRELRHKKGSFLDSAIPSLLHRDLSVGNIVVNEQNKEVRFIDPRDQIPQLNEKCNFSTGGNIAFDLIGYYVSVLRKNRELNVNYSFEMSEIIEDIKREINSYKNKGVFSFSLEKLCLAVWYSVYVGCRCDYCLAPERKWLYNEMIDNLKKELELLNS